MSHDFEVPYFFRVMIRLTYFMLLNLFNSFVALQSDSSKLLNYIENSD